MESFKKRSLWINLKGLHQKAKNIRYASCKSLFMDLSKLPEVGIRHLMSLLKSMAFNRTLMSIVFIRRLVGVR